ncbi:MAG: hypothetical protein PHN84_04390 [Desulfuromonadaceae bacterium]|nr:hypothetical protein [Desulfuromonadaceae bacterium]MDD2854306.1 hypothetical protein [Desulfuromonadaceae bacterium]
MAKELYVGHISEQATEEDLRKLFGLMGVVTSVHLIVDEQTGEFKRCGYVRMLSEVNLNEVVETLDGAYLIDRCIVVSIAVPQKDRPAKTPYVRRKPNSDVSTDRKQGTPRGSKAKTAGSSTTANSKVKTKENSKSGRSSSATEAAGKHRPSSAKDTRTPSFGKRTGRTSSNNKSAASSSNPKGRR